MAELTSSVATPKTRKQEKMFSDLELAIVALVLVFTLGCIMLDRKNNNARKRTPTRKPTRKRMRVTRRHCDDLYHRTQRGPEENTDEESYNMR